MSAYMLFSSRHLVNTSLVAHLRGLVDFFMQMEMWLCRRTVLALTALVAGTVITLISQWRHLPVAAVGDFRDQSQLFQVHSNPKTAWIVFLRIPRTGSTFLSESVAVRSHGCDCGWRKCRCRTGSVSAMHGVPCSRMTCVQECHREGCRRMWRDAPRADWLELQMAFLRARVSGSV